MNFVLLVITTIFDAVLFVLIDESFLQFIPKSFIEAVIQAQISILVVRPSTFEAVSCTKYFFYLFFDI